MVRRGWRQVRGPEARQRGAVAVELTLLVPALVLVIGLLVAGGRLWLARTAVTEAAAAGARAASLARSAGEAGLSGREAAARSLTTAGARCSSRSVSVGVSAFSTPPGTPGTVTAVVTCTVSLSDVALPGLPGAIRLSASGAAALDTYRGRE